MAASDTVLVSVADGVSRLTLNRPDRLNAFTGEMLGVLREAVESAGADPAIRAVLLSGSGRAFCAGQDLAAIDSSDGGGLGAVLESHYNPLIRAIRALEKPVVCAVNGVAAGAGANLALACDMVLAARSARFIQAFCKIGLLPDCGGSWTLTRLVGEARAKALALTGEPLGAEDAAAWGLIWRAVDDDRLMAEAQTLASALAEGPTIGLGLTKRAIQAASANALDAQLDLERDLQRVAGRTADYTEGVAAFLDKRPPRFTGRA